jgi:hypothetical protein
MVSGAVSGGAFGAGVGVEGDNPSGCFRAGGGYAEGCKGAHAGEQPFRS